MGYGNCLCVAYHTKYFSLYISLILSVEFPAHKMKVGPDDSMVFGAGHPMRMNVMETRELLF